MTVNGITWQYVIENDSAIIGESAFVSCSSLAGIIFEGLPPLMDRSVFLSCSSNLIGYYKTEYKDAWEAVAKMATGKTDAGGRALTVLDDYIAGTDPTDEGDTFHAVIEMGADGKPVIVWEPALNDDETHKGVKNGVRTYKVFGNTGLSADGWMEVEQDASGDWRRVDTGEIVAPQFFKVSVAMP